MFPAHVSQHERQEVSAFEEFAGTTIGELWEDPYAAK